MSQRISRQEELALKKRYLQLHSIVLRHQMQQQLGSALAPLSVAGQRLYTATGWARRHPWLVGGAVAALVLWQPRGLGVLVGRATWWWQTWRSVQAMLASRR